MAGLESTGAGADMIDGARSVGLEFAQTTARKGTADDERHISGRVLRGLSGAAAGPPDQRLPVVRGDPDPDRARGGLGRRSLVHLQHRRRKDDRYPSTDEQQAAHLEIPDPDAERLNRWLPLVKWLLAIPHYIVLLFLDIGVLVSVVVAWFAILFTGVYRWHNRVIGYALILVTDRYPPFSLQP